MKTAFYYCTAAALAALAMALSLGAPAEHEQTAQSAKPAAVVEDQTASLSDPPVVVGACQTWGGSPWSTAATTCDVNRAEKNASDASTDALEAMPAQVAGRDVLAVAQALASNTLENNTNFMLLMQECMDPGPPGHEEGCRILRSYASTFVANLEALKHQGNGDAQEMLAIHLDQERALVAKPRKWL